MKILEIRRHGIKGTNNEGDCISSEGMRQIMEVGRSPEMAQAKYTHLYTSPTVRAPQTLCGFVAAAGHCTFDGPVIKEGLITPFLKKWKEILEKANSYDVSELRKIEPEFIDAEAKRLADVFREIFEEIPEGAYALVVGHSPMAGCSIYGLTRKTFPALKECEGFVIILEDDEIFTIEERRL